MLLIFFQSDASHWCLFYCPRFSFSQVQKQSTQSHTAQDTQVLWEQEMKSRTQLGLRLAELEKEKGELSNKVIVVMDSGMAFNSMSKPACFPEIYFKIPLYFRWKQKRIKPSS